MGLLLNLRLIGLAAFAVAAWFVYGWGNTIIQNYSAMQAEITTLRRNAQLWESREASYKLRIERRDAAIAASACKATVEAWVKDPSKIPRARDPFNSSEAP